MKTFPSVKASPLIGANRSREVIHRVDVTGDSEPASCAPKSFCVVKGKELKIAKGGGLTKAKACAAAGGKWTKRDTGCHGKFFFKGGRPHIQVCEKTKPTRVFEVTSAVQARQELNRACHAKLRTRSAARDLGGLPISRLLTRRSKR